VTFVVNAMIVNVYGVLLFLDCRLLVDDYTQSFMAHHVCIGVKFQLPLLRGVATRVHLLTLKRSTVVVLQCIFCVNFCSILFSCEVFGVN